MSDELNQNPELASVLAAAGAVDAAADEAAGTAPAAADEAPAVDPVELWASVPQTVGSVLAMALPELKDVYSKQACRAWGVAMVPVAMKHGWQATALPVEIPAIFATLGFVIPTAMAIKARRSQQRQKATESGAQVLDHGAGDGVAGD